MGIETTIQDLPGRTLGFGMPRSGPMDNLSFAIGNLLVGNAQNTEGLEIAIVPGTLPTWQTWSKGKDFLPTKPWLLEAFDQVRFSPVSESEYIEIEKQFDAGRYTFQIEPTVFSLHEHSQFLDTIQDELGLFRERQAEASSQLEIREKLLFQEWQVSRKVSSGNTIELEAIESAFRVTSSLYASIWKIRCKPGDVISSASDILLILEAMKTEIPVTAGEDNVGKKVCRLGKDVKEGASVRPGDVLVTFF